MTTSSTHVQLQADQRNIDDIRNLTLCKVCLRPFYEPFILICGHTFCYGCLRSWFCGDSNRRKKKNCPECRTTIKTTPVPNYSLRNLAHMFLDRPELIPEDETQAEHDKGKTEEARLLSTDRQGEGLFKGVFRTLEVLSGERAIHDVDDGIERCPLCAWEIEEGMCNHCGWEDPGHEFSDYEEDSEMESEDNMGEVEDPISYLWSDHAHGPHGVPTFDPALSETIDSSADEDEYGTPRPYGEDFDEVDDDGMGDFISDDEDRPMEAEDDLDRWTLSRLARINRRNLNDDTNHFPELTSEYTDTTHDGEAMPFSPIDSDEDEDIGEIGRRNRRNHRILSDEDDDDESVIANARHAEMTIHDAGGLSSRNAQLTEDEDQHTNYDESDSEARSVTPIFANPRLPKRRAHVVISDDEDEEEVDEQSQGQVEDDDDDDEDDSDNQEQDTVSNIIDDSDEDSPVEDSDVSDDSSPPQTTARRIQRLNVHQAARSRRSTSNEQRPNDNTLHLGSLHHHPTRRTEPTSTANRTRGRPFRSTARVY